MRNTLISGLLIGLGFAGGHFSPAATNHGGVTDRDHPSAHLVQAGETSADITGSKPAAVTQIQRAPDGLFYVNVRVNGAMVRFVVDSGASVTVLTKKDAAASHVSTGEKANVPIQTAGGAAPMRWAKLGSLSFAGQTLTDVDAAVVDSGLQTSLLGQNALASFGAVVQNGTMMQFTKP